MSRYYIYKFPPVPGYNYSATADTKVQVDWTKSIIQEAESKKENGSKYWPPEVKDLQALVQGNAQLRMLASAMLDEVPIKEPYVSDPKGTKQIYSWDQLLNIIAHIATEAAPTWNGTKGDIGLVGYPLNMVLDWPMATPSGHSFFFHPEVNLKFKAILDSWSKNVLQTSISQKVLTTDKDGWLSPEARAKFESDTNGETEGLSFIETFECDPDGDPKHWGFHSWDDFFTRKFRDINITRPIGFKTDNKWIVNACEAKTFSIQANVKEHDTFWLKDQPYSVSEMLNYHEEASTFAGGTVYQAFLNKMSYHRWNSPVEGKVIYSTVVPGAYFSKPVNAGFTHPDGPEPATVTRSMGYLAHVATRAILLIDTGGETGVVGVLFVGMAEVSTCDIADQFRSENLPRKVAKGDELGMFHHGGSTYCLLFQKGVKLAFVDDACASNASKNLQVRSPLAYTYQSDPSIQERVGQRSSDGVQTAPDKPEETRSGLTSNWQSGTYNRSLNGYGEQSYSRGHGGDGEDGGYRGRGGYGGSGGNRGRGGNERYGYGGHGGYGGFH